MEEGKANELLNGCHCSDISSEFGKMLNSEVLILFSRTLRIRVNTSLHAPQNLGKKTSVSAALGSPAWRISGDDNAAIQRFLLNYIFTATVSFMHSTRFSSKSENSEYPLNFEWARASLTKRLDPRHAGRDCRK